MASIAGSASRRSCRRRLRRHGIAATVVDGGVSGDTSQAGRARLGWTLDGLARKPDLVIVELGANDMLRALDPALTGPISTPS